MLSDKCGAFTIERDGLQVSVLTEYGALIYTAPSDREAAEFHRAVKKAAKTADPMDDTYAWFFGPGGGRESGDFNA
jgi:hypothetical protein